MINFKFISWTNFLGVGKNSIELDLNSKKMTLLSGKSGSGKSTLLDAITFCLYNKPFRKINKPYLVNAVNEKNCLVEVKFSIGNNQYEIKRGIKPNIFEIILNGELLNQDANLKDYQSILETQILKMNYKTFIQVVVLGASNFIPFMQLKSSDRREIIESLLDIEIFTKMNDLLRVKKSSSKELLSDCNNKIFKITQQIKYQEDYINNLKKDEHSKKNKLKIEIDEYKINKSVVSETIKSTKIKIDNFLMTDEDIKNINTKIDAINKTQIQISTKLKSNEKLLSFYNKNNICPSCDQNIQHEFKENKIKDLCDIVNNLKIGVDKSNKMLIELNENKTNLLKIKSEYDNLVSDLKNKNNELSLIQKLITKLETEYNTESSNFDIILNESNELSERKSKLKSLSQIKLNINKKLEIIETSSLILKDGGVKSMILKEYIPVINRQTNRFLDIMNFNIHFNLDEDFKENIKSTGKEFFMYENFSEGERQRLDLALLFTWRSIAKSKNSVNTNLLIMDEIVDSYLDIDATENVLSIFSDNIFNDTNIFLISHKDNIDYHFDSVLKFSKKLGFSTIGE